MVKVKRRGVKAQFEVQYVQSHKLSSLVALIKGGPDAASSSLQVQKSNHQDMLHQAQWKQSDVHWSTNWKYR